MSEVLRIHLELAVKDGQLDALLAVRDKLIAAAKEDGTLGYEFSISEDQKSVHIAERYASSAQFLVHLGNFGAHAEAFLAAGDVTKIVMYGAPSDEVKGALADFNPSYFAHWGGYTK